jgi:hypothetical protein
MEATIQSSIKTKYILKSLLFCVVFTGLFVAFSFTKHFLPNSLERLAHGIIGTVAAFLTTVLFLKFDRKRFSDIGLTFKPDTVVKFFAGLIAGIILMGILAMGVLYFSHVRIEVNPRSNVWHFLFATLPLLPLAFMEELGFRAYPLEKLKDKVGIRPAIIITALLFALYHIANGWTIANSFLGPAVWGLVFGLAAIYSKGIALPTGIHYAANLTTAAFGAAGNTVALWTVKQSHDSTANNGETEWITILPSLALLVFAILFIELYLRRTTTANNALEKAGLT